MVVEEEEGGIGRVEVRDKGSGDVMFLNRRRKNIRMEIVLWWLLYLILILKI